MPDDKGDAPADTGFFGAITSAIGTSLSYVADSVNSVMGFYDELEVNNPEGQAQDTSDAGPDTKQRQAAFTSYKDYIGMDITSLVTLPVWIMEPFTILQRLAEIMEYSPHLDTAAGTEDQYERLLWVLAFAMGPYACMERTWKPFNPILGETFEVELDQNVKFFAEQVSHHPPIGVGHGENEHWTYDIVSAPSTKFLGNSVEIYPIGRSRIKLKSTGELFTLRPCNVKAHNVIVGGVWVDNEGDYTLENTTTGAKAHLYFTPCGWFSSGRYEVSGHVTSAEGEKIYTLGGKWNDFLDAQRCDQEGNPLPDAPVIHLWKAAAKPEGDKYGFTHFAHKLMSSKGINPLRSDSRRRADRLALQKGETSEAATAKHTLEEIQRAEKREREARGEKWTPRYFKSTAGAKVFDIEFTEEECPLWEYAGDAFKQPRDPATVDVAGKDFCPWQYPELADE
mmetsp:Transcript_11257/g.33809  ORF Transcript_11257/g.33809 Transcript_11257/m.33809 type:complete len:452 (-) Transcript_11257:444-1799(-)|eukprot:CAMPEP_0206140690 /NCGR_PEP_ID=MMETSP1473-20131121/10333_1 /ASSEMBLY_ACC=CAM_ASM_001109 /TAXON_ID=1461547 /ORGANISM="Stichococcus sp, Strain RCC1054" /LENGTH=451 /DNA_ID=CAMNT_0053534935 /DNA_START=129 /DNA_END=1484 /DNA_ORIENTATION=-